MARRQVPRGCPRQTHAARDQAPPEEGAAGRRAGWDVYDAVFLQPAHLPAAARSDFSRAAARSWQRSRAGLPAHAERVKLLSRRARIGIDAESARRAVASVVVRAAGWRGARRFRLLHRATLWIERGARGWRIVAYDLAQGPAHT